MEVSDFHIQWIKTDRYINTDRETVLIENIHRFFSSLFFDVIHIHGIPGSDHVKTLAIDFILVESTSEFPKDHTSLTRRLTLQGPTQIADRIYRTARGLFDQVGDEGPYRLIGVGLSQLLAETQAGPDGDLLDPEGTRRAGAERATDAIRERFGEGAILKGRALR